MMISTSSFFGILLYAVTLHAHPGENFSLTPGLAVASVVLQEVQLEARLQAPPEVFDWLDWWLLPAVAYSYPSPEHSWSIARVAEIWPECWLAKAFFITFRLLKLIKKPRYAFTTLYVMRTKLILTLSDAVHEILSSIVASIVFRSFIGVSIVIFTIICLCDLLISALPIFMKLYAWLQILSGTARSII
jgi:hypothetical protein